MHGWLRTATLILMCNRQLATHAHRSVFLVPMTNGTSAAPHAQISFQASPHLVPQLSHTSCFTLSSRTPFTSLLFFSPPSESYKQHQTLYRKYINILILSAPNCSAPTLPPPAQTVISCSGRSAPHPPPHTVHNSTHSTHPPTYPAKSYTRTNVCTARQNSQPPHTNCPWCP